MICTCHREATTSHEACCGHDEGRDPDCPQHGDGSGPEHCPTAGHGALENGDCPECGYTTQRP